MRSREYTALRLLFALGVTGVVALFVGVGVIFATQHRENPKAPDYRVVEIGGIEYESMQGRPIDPANQVDHEIITGLPEQQRNVTPKQALYGAFIGITNDSSRPLPTADRIELRDEGGHVYRPLSLPLTNPYAYSQRTLRPGTRIPAFGSVADDNLAATGQLLVFRVPKKAYQAATLELVIHDPSRPGSTASLII